MEILKKKNLPSIEERRHSFKESLKRTCDQHDRCPAGRDDLLSDYGVEMYPRKSIWTRGVLALGAGILLLSGLQRWSEATVRTKGSDDARSIRVDGSENDSPSIFERSKESARDVDNILPGSWQIEDDRRWKRSARFDRRKEEGSIFEDSAETDAIHEKRRASSSIDINDREIDGDGLLLRRNFRTDEADRTLGESSKRDWRHVIMRTDDMRSIDINSVARISSEAKAKRRLIEQEGSRNEKNDDQAIDIATLRNDRSEVEETESRSRSEADDPRSRLDVFRLRETSINADNDLRSSTLSPIQGSIERSARSSDRHGSLDRDPHILQNAGAENEEGIFALSRSIIADKSVKRQRDKIEENSPGGRASIPEFLERNERNIQRSAAEMPEELLFFHENRQRAESSAMRPTIQDHKDLSYERERKDETSEGNLIREFEEFENNDENDVRESDLSINKEDRSQDAPFEDLNSNVDSEFRDESDDEESSSDTSAFQILDSIPSDNKRGKVTRGEDSKDLMVANNFALTTRDPKINPGALISEYRPIFARNKRKMTRNNFIKKMIRSIDRRRNAWTFAGSSDNAESTAIQKADGHETAIGDRRKRRANYYSAQSATPMAYVHIQPAYPAAPPTSRKCVRCMVFYKPRPPCPPKPPPRIVLPSYRYHEPASKWRGLKYGE